MVTSSAVVASSRYQKARTRRPVAIANHDPWRIPPLEVHADLAVAAVPWFGRRNTFSKDPARALLLFF